MQLRIDQDFFRHALAHTVRPKGASRARAAVLSAARIFVQSLVQMPGARRRPPLKNRGRIQIGGAQSPPRGNAASQPRGGAAPLPGGRPSDERLDNRIACEPKSAAVLASEASGSERQIRTTDLLDEARRAGFAQTALAFRTCFGIQPRQPLHRSPVRGVLLLHHRAHVSHLLPRGIRKCSALIAT